MDNNTVGNAKKVKKENWFKNLFEKYLNILKDQKPQPKAKDGDQGIVVAAKVLEEFPKFTVRKIFFQEVNGAPHMYFLMESGDCFELPYPPNCGVTLLTNKGMIEDLEEMRAKRIENTDTMTKQIDSLKEEIRNGMD